MVDIEMTFFFMVVFYGPNGTFLFSHDVPGSTLVLEGHKGYTHEILSTLRVQNLKVDRSLRDDSYTHSHLHSPPSTPLRRRPV